MFSLFLRTLLIGIAVAAPVGAMAMLCIDRTLARGWRAGMSTGLGIATADGLYGAVAAFGVTAISGFLVEWQAPLRFVGGIVLLAIGVRSALRRPPDCAADDGSASLLGFASLYAGAVVLTLTNPLTIIAFAAVFVSAGLSASGGAAEATVATLGIALGSLAWWCVLVTATSTVRHGIGPSSRVWLGRISGSFVAAFGLFALLSAFSLT